MAANTITFTLDNFCAAGAHGELSFLVDAVSTASKHVVWSDEKEVPTNEELKDAVYIIAREMVNRSGANSKAEVQTVIDAMTITLDYPVV